MAAAANDQSDGTFSRRASTSSLRSQRSDYSQPSSRFMDRQTSTSMSGGAGSRPGSPTARLDPPQSALSPDAIDRVFPIRSAVSIDSTATPAPRTETVDHFPSLSIGNDSTIAARRDSLRRPPAEKKSPSPPRRSTTPQRRSSPSRRRSMASLDDRSMEPGNVAKDRKTSTSTSASNPLRDSQTLNQLIADSASGRSSMSGGASLAPSRAESAIGGDAERGLLTARFQHVISDGGHTVVTGRDGETLQRCEDEPIHIPGAVQSFGLLVALREEEGKLVVRVVSENSDRIIGYTPSQLFLLPNFLDIFTEEQADNLLDHLDFIRDYEAADVVSNGPEVFMLSLRPPGRRTQKLWCAMHVNDSNRDIIVCEFEIEDDRINPLVYAGGEETPEPPEDTLGREPSPEELAESTINHSKPLRVLRSARKKRGEAAAMEVFNIMSQVQAQLVKAPSLHVFLRVLVGVVKELTGFHRVMVYQFDQAWNGRVVTELVDPRATKDLYKGLNFPASDIPRQARDMYKLNKVRLLYDRDQETARLVCRTMEDLETPLDLTHAYLRAMSPIHIKYLANMAVRSSMSISINAFGELWGLIACHAYGGHGMRVSFPIRKMCRLIGDTASHNIERLSYASRLQARKLINTSSTATNPSGYIVASSDDLLRLFDADVAALSIRDETKITGNAKSHMQEILAVTEYLRLRQFNAVYTSQDIKTDFPDLRYAPGLKFLAGVLFVPLSAKGNDFIAFFRKGVVQEVKWAGNPYEKFVKEGTEGYLEPRRSFKTWSETVCGRARDWSEEEIETASVLCLVYGKFIDVWRQKEAALQNSQLTKLLLANSAHEVRTPLNAIINYLEIALEGSLDQETRDNLSKSHSASKSLIYVINDLLDLAKAEDGNDLVKEEPFDLNLTLQEATDPFIGDAKRKNIEYVVTFSPDLPRHVIGDFRRVRQVVANLVTNAIQHTSTGTVSVDAWRSLEQPSDNRVEVEVAVEDTGAGMSRSTVDAIFRELEEISYEGEDHSRSLEQEPYVKKEHNRHRPTLGLGLAVVARTIRNMNGQLRLKTEEGKGSRFVIHLAFDIDQESATPQSLESKPPSLLHDASGASAVERQSQATSPGEVKGEVTLVRRSAQKKSDSAALSRRQSADSMNSIFSKNSKKSRANSVHSNASRRSDVDRLIDAIQEPFLDGDARSQNSDRQELSPQRQKSIKSRSIGSIRDMSLPSAFAKIPGEEKVTDSGVPIKAVRVPEEGAEKRTTPGGARGKVMFGGPAAATHVSPERHDDAHSDLSTERFSVLVAEDDPINSRIIQKRLEKLGYVVHVTVNGEECSSMHGEGPSGYDAVLMDLQMPIVDGFSSTKMIRSFEKTHAKTCLSRRASHNGRIPIFAVSASLIERDRQKYIEAGFDGWILKPVDFKRTDLLLKGIVDEEARNSCLYQPGAGNWEQGGWFEKRSRSSDDVDTGPSQASPTRSMEDKRQDTDGDILVGVVDERGLGSGAPRSQTGSEPGSMMGSKAGSIKSGDGGEDSVGSVTPTQMSIQGDGESDRGGRKSGGSATPSPLNKDSAS